MSSKDSNQKSKQDYSNQHVARKQFGQNFLCDKNIINKIVRHFGPDSNKLILEIGPGLGALTEQLLAYTDFLYLVEIDKDLAKYLLDKFTEQKIHLFNQDILKFDLNNIFNNNNQNNKINIIGNLPYNISTPILFHLFKQINSIESMLFMLQLEVVDRIVAKPNTKQYGRLSVMAQYFCHAEKLFHISANAFNPKPKVESAIISLIPRQDINLDADLISILSEIVLAAFNQRRKTISNSLSKYIKNTDILAKLSIDPKARAENLSVEQYTHLAQEVLNKQEFR